MSFDVVVLCIVAAPIALYVVARVISAAYFRSKRAFIKDLTND